ncbi:dynamin family protein [Glutamicibacter uratoxydans]|uniref:dynamin family protein n=1 Tax=Glutamicibacter uratoxydans TaxID=43667 RepID=UPI003D6EEDAA
MDPNQRPAQPAGRQSEISPAVSALGHTLETLATILQRMVLIHGHSSDQEDPETLRVQLINQINDYLLPRSADAQAPLLTVVGGSTGAGKSTLVNSLLGETVTWVGVVRPTTRTPVLIHHPDEADWFSTTRVLSGLSRLHGSGFESGEALQRTDAVLLVAHPGVPVGLAILDAPDIDSVSEDNRALSQQLLNAADLWIFVTTANRYSDAVPWKLLEKAGERAVTVSVVLNRVPEGAAEQIRPDLENMMESKALDPALLHIVHESELTTDRLIPTSELTELRGWLEQLGADSAERQRVAAQTLRGALEQLAVDLNQLQDAAANQDAFLRDLEEGTVRRFGVAVENTLEALSDGSLLRGEILARWQDFVGAGELMRGIEGTIGRVRDKVAGFFSGKPPATHRVESAIESGLHTVLVNEITKACQDVDRQWIATALGTELLLETQAPRPATNLSDRASEVIRAWQKDVLEMIRTEGAGKRKTARIAAFGVNGIAVALMVLVFASTAGLTGLEIGIAGGSAVVGQKLLEAIFGEDAVRRMTQRASSMLRDHCQGLINENKWIYTQVTSQALSASVTAELDAHIRGLAVGGNAK